VRVLESFRVSKAGDLVNLMTGLGGGDCGYRSRSAPKYPLIERPRGGRRLLHRHLHPDCVYRAKPGRAPSPSQDRCWPESSRPHRHPPQPPGLPEEAMETPSPGIRVSLQPVAGGPSMESTTDSYGSSSSLHSRLATTTSHSTCHVSHAVWTNISGYIDDQIPTVVQSITKMVQVQPVTSSSLWNLPVASRESSRRQVQTHRWLGQCKQRQCQR